MIIDYLTKQKKAPLTMVHIDVGFKYGSRIVKC